MTWVDGGDTGHYSIHHLPYGAFSTDADPDPRLGVRIAGDVLDLRALAAADCTDPALRGALSATVLNDFMAAGPEAWALTRARITELLTEPRWRDTVAPLLVPFAETRAHQPFATADYVDFYSSEHHATNVGRMFRPDSDPLLPNWKRLPVGYHGRAGTVVPSGTPIVRPRGQRRDGDGVAFGPSRRLDIEAEVGFVVGVPTRLGDTVPTGDFAAHVFGVVLVNDWSARDIQAWEYQPLGPFLGKSFATSVAAWVTPLAALDAARTDAPVQDPEPLPYLVEPDRFAFDLALTVTWNGTEVARPPFAQMYWTPAQQLAHLTVNGASLRTGDLFASGTVSGPERSQRGSFLELSWNGTEPVALADGSERTFLDDGDSVVIGATAPGPDGTVIGLADVEGTVMPARQ